MNPPRARGRRPRVPQFQDCLFCAFVTGAAQASTVFEDDHVMGVMTIRPHHVGHVLLFPKAHVEDFACVDPSGLSHLFHVAARLKSAICDAIPCSGFQLLINQGEATGQKNDCKHLHLHLLPRSLGVAIDLNARAPEVPRIELDKAARQIARQLATS